MKKKITNLAFLLMMLVSFTSLVGCGEKHEHSYSNEVVNPTCVEKGYTIYKCECGESYQDDYVDALGHDVQTHNLKEPTCTEEGYDTYYTCSRCDYTTYVAKPATGHTYTTEVVNPTCEEQGYTLHTCGCGDSYKDTYVDALSHSYGEWFNATDPSCTTAGEKRRDCENCEHYETSTLEASGHDYEATYTWDEYECKITLVCKNDSTHVLTEAMTISNEVTKEPTCTEEGTKLYTASFTIDGVTYTDTKTEKLGMVNHTMNGNECVNCDYAFTEGLEYTLSEDGTYYIVSDIGTTTETEIYIPSEYNSLPVLSIGDNAFSSEEITKVVIPNGVTSIGNSAFKWCNSLESIIIPNSVTSIGSSAFNQCRSLLSITIPEGLTSIGGATFYQCVLLTSITIPSTVTSIGMNAFYQCYELRNITIPDNVTSIGLNAFFGCTSLEYNTLGNGKYLGNNENPYVVLVRTISKEITEIDIHNDTKLIYSYAFENCTALTSVAIPDGVTNIGEEAFSGCTSLGNVTIPNSVTSIGGSAFKDCTSLVSITIPNSITSIETRAFYNCSSLASITIHDSVTSISGAAFYNCTSIENVYFTGSQEQWNAITINSNNSNLTSATITYNYVVE